jgi:hypothetical protein
MEKTERILIGIKIICLQELMQIALMLIGFLATGGSLKSIDE